MPPVPKVLERKMFNSLKRLFFGFIDDIRNGFVEKAHIQGKAREFLESEEVDTYLKNLMSRMTARLRIDTAKEFKKSATAGTNSRMMYELMKHEMDGPVGQRIYEIISENAQYIKTVPQFWADYITLYAQREALKGKRPEEIAANLRKIMPSHITKNLKCIARTEVAKANAAITQARAEAVGCKCYIWRTVKDERVRASHRAMEGKLVFYDSPPNAEKMAGEKYFPANGYHAGNIYNCRCWQQVVVDERFLPDTINVCRHGRNQTFTKNKFMKTFGNIT